MVYGRVGATDERSLSASKQFNHAIAKGKPYDTKYTKSLHKFLIPNMLHYTRLYCPCQAFTGKNVVLIEKYS